MSSDGSTTTADDRVAIVTGAAGGLGSAMARRFAARGMAVALVDLAGDALDAVADDLASTGAPACAMATDLADPDAIAAMADEVAATFGGIDVLVNNAATYELQPWTDITVERWDHTLAVNLRAQFLCARAAHRHLAASGAGRIVNIASSTFFTGWAGLLDYVSSKGGIVGFTRSLARELGPDGITVNCVSPGAIPTAAEEHHEDQVEFNQQILDNQCVKRRGTPTDIAVAVEFFSSREAGFLTGQTLEVDGGWVLT